MYRPGHSPYDRPKSRWWRSRAVVIAAAAALVFGGSWLVRIFDGGAFRLGATVAQTGSLPAALIDTATRLIRGSDAILAHNRVLQDRVAELESRLLNYQSLRSDHEALLASVGFVAQNPSTVIGRVLTTLWTNPYDVLLVELPAGRLVEPQSAVTFADALYLGRVVAVNGRIAQVQLLSAPGSVIPVAVGTSTTITEAHGRGGGNFQITLPRGVPVAVGDVVHATSSPQRWSLGRIGNIEREPSDSSQTLFFRYPLNLQTLKFVEIHVR